MTFHNSKQTKHQRNFHKAVLSENVNENSGIYGYKRNKWRLTPENKGLLTGRILFQVNSCTTEGENIIWGKPTGTIF